MKSLKYLVMIALASGVLASCNTNDTPEGKGDATIGFEKEQYTFKESAGLQRIPVKFTGEPKHYPITFDVAVELGMGDSDDTIDTLMYFTQTVGLKNAGIENAPVYIEFTVRDNQYINESRYAQLTITNVKGAELAEATTLIEIADNDNNPYERLWGDWTLSSTAGSFDISISGGFTDKEISDNADKLLVCWGWAGYKEDLTGYGYEPEHQPVWYLSYDAENKRLYTVPGALLTNLFSFNGIDEDVDVKIGTGTVVGENLNVVYDTPIAAVWSDDMNKITFDTNYYLVSGVFGVSGTNYGYWHALGKVVLTRK